ncbi:MAG: hypothetical protein IIC88_05320 [Chloroflexi bacterium]|nr:hypothetical protein [Chloroflexota bacterium]
MLQELAADEVVCVTFGPGHSRAVEAIDAMRRSPASQSPQQQEAKAVAVRQRDGANLGALPLFQVIDRLKDEVTTKC